MSGQLRVDFLIDDAGTGSPSFPNKIQNSSLELATSDTGALKLPAGTTAQRPASPVAGMIRQNTGGGIVETYNGTVWVAIGSQDAYPIAVDFLVVAGGGGGGGRYHGGGGGAGGYTGGSGSNSTPAGGGGGSFNAGTNQSNTAGARSGAGQVQITLL